jgi:hypothetical protein
MARLVATGLALSALLMGPAFAAPATEIPLYSETLARALGPTQAPFIVTYRARGKVLAFVGADHVFTDSNPTTDAIARAFAEVDPAAVIIEGFPSAFGANPGFIVESVRRRREPGADSYARSEGSFAASLALDKRVPFFGGEPTLEEEIDGLVAKGYARRDASFAMLLRAMGQARRSGEMPAGDSGRFAARFEQEARAVAGMMRTAPVTQSEFVASYRRLVGVDPVSDAAMAQRYDPGTDTLLQRMGADNMRVRDEHLLRTILRQLDRYGRVLVVYGSSHWTTLAQALRARLGKPSIDADAGVSGS